ncbi:TPA: hypothetical protein RNX34_002151 [Pasteurella multocida]|uniref:hypothetical protein n=1 Tax=Pasteurella multocida TaxID=747 RepID=UPI00109375BD|nr:hypothetical protein [Pasteurella multocida]QCA32163.1 hypothetical protein E5U06_09680 [Pasteurella multocida]QXG51765.1 hypothetical protein KSF84_01470 [Pasteurella multocida]WGE13650.1 hypothetical protein PM3_0278 [Pasteurella multocida]HDX0990417.1 hypothetical protein [Pasteurella multocida]HDX1015684.1 hypothetical protein [Pasteurella multocida]
MRKLVILASCSFMALPALADSATIFSCTASDGNQIQIQKVGSDYQFSYGKISFKNLAKQVLKNEGSYVAIGSGFTTSSLEMKSKSFSYTIEFVQPKGSNRIDSPILYITKGNDMTEIRCDTNKKIDAHFEYKKMNNL